MPRRRWISIASLMLLTGCSSSPVTGTAIAPVEATSIAPFPAPATPGQEPADLYDQIRARGVNRTDDQLKMDLGQVCMDAMMFPQMSSEDDLVDMMSTPPGELSRHDAKVIVKAAMLYTCPKFKAAAGAR